jgi:hypothetical protein
MLRSAKGILCFRLARARNAEAGGIPITDSAGEAGLWKCLTTLEGMLRRKKGFNYGRNSRAALDATDGRNAEATNHNNLTKNNNNDNE